ncbi:ThiF family adenylyltransferase [Marivita sp.]|uniref:ThiF family adenylyltransferase n=1 Tax=Marivita sp. TaxID=2003365 RepID=UPI0025BF41D7|nr:ThiF family adenylyltransferase [Marivita sp.]
MFLRQRRWSAARPHRGPGMAADLDGITGATFQDVAADALTDDGLKALADLASRDGYEGCTLVSCHRDDGETEVVVVEVYVELGQAARVNDVREREAVAVVTDPERAIPSVYPLRAEFPQHLPHMNLNYRGRRRSLCLFDARAEDIVHLYNPAMLIERVRWWMQKSAFGELHGVDQPLDPALAPSFWSLVLPPDFDATTNTFYAALPRTNHLISPILLWPWDSELGTDVQQYACSHIVTQPTAHGAMIDLPANVAELLEIYAELDVDLTGEIRKLFDGDLTDPKLRTRMQRSLLLLITTPLTGADGTVGAKTTRAFLSPDTSLLDVGKALGIASDEGGAIGRLVAVPTDEDALKAQRLLPLNVVDGFTPEMARTTSGRSDAPNRKLVAIGVGALGSQSVLNLARMGQSKWGLIDQDFVAPHNLARHAAPGHAIGCSKSEVLAQEINGLFQKEEAIALHAGIGGDDTPDDVRAALSEAERVIDFTASVQAARWLGHDADMQAPVSSYFVNPSGTALVALHEGAQRQGREGVVEMAYYAALSETEALTDHLATSGQVRIGSCRDVSVTIPQSRMALIAGLAAADIQTTHTQPDAQVTIWSIEADGNVSVDRRTVDPFRDVTLGEWTVMVAPRVIAEIEIARGDGAVETGGILLGGFDLDRRTLYVTAALPCPSDSKAGRSYFDRGARGVQDAIADVERTTMRHITYIGEWHTHPAGSTSAPSSLDRTLLNWVADLRQLFLMPGLLLILGDDGLRVIVEKAGLVEESILTI